MLHHLSFAVSNLERAAKFYDPVLGALGYVRVWTAADAVGYGREEGEDQFAIKAAGQVQTPSARFHVAFAAASRRSVDEFHRVALEQGGADDGAPGLRPHYGAHYYAAFVLDPDGYRIEAVITSPAEEP
jgi:catechol 2,3-dioxygenase-like lactoylglutathione lyase family enzyme